MRNAEDRRVRKTKTLLRDALVSLILEKDYDSIIVQEIIDRANVGRSTFYLHFEDKDDLLASGIDELGKNLRAALAAQPAGSQKPVERLLGFSLFMFEHVHSHRALYMALSAKRRSFVRQGVQNVMEDVIKGQAKSVIGKGVNLSIPFDLLAHFLASSFISIMTWWLRQKSPLPPKEINKIFRELVTPSVAANINSR